MQNFRTPSDMPAVGPQLKALRLRAKPALSIRKMADELGIGHSRYQYFEDPNRYKKAALPLDLTRAIAAVLTLRGVDPAEVMALAGLTDSEAEPEGREIESQRPVAQFATLRVELPSEVALTDMFESLLAIVPSDATRTETAQILARRLGVGLSACGPLAIEQAGERENIPPLSAAHGRENRPST